MRARSSRVGKGTNVLLVVIWLVTACGTGELPTQTPKPPIPTSSLSVALVSATPVPLTDTPTMTATAPAPTATLTPISPTVTETPRPSRTPTATSTPMPDYEQLVQVFDYDKDLPLDLVVESQEQQGNATVQTISYAGGLGFRVPAYLVLPVREGPCPAIIYVHKGAGNKHQFLAEAIALADSNVASLLLDSPFVPKLDGEDEVRADYPGTNREGSIRQVIDIRRGLDLLETIPEVDASRIGYVGHSHGAVHGGIVIGVETRIKAYVFVAGLAEISTRFSNTLLGPGMVAWEFDPAMDPIHYVGHGSPAPILFQFGELDHFIERAQARLYYDVASEPKTIRWYTADHHSIEWVGRRDRLQWLGDQLGFAYESED